MYVFFSFRCWAFINVCVIHVSFLPLFSLSDMSHEWGPDRLHRSHHEPVSRQRLPPLWVLFLGGEGGPGLQHHLYHRTLPNQPAVWWAGDLWRWAGQTQRSKVGSEIQSKNSSQKHLIQSDVNLMLVGLGCWNMQESECSYSGVGCKHLSERSVELQTEPP